MKLTLAQIQTLTQDPEYTLLPITLSTPANKYANWIDHAHEMTKEGLKMTIWHVHYMMAAVFDIYGKAIEEIRIVHNERYDFFKIYINNYSCFHYGCAERLNEEDLPLSEHDHEVFQHADNYATLMNFLETSEALSHVFYKQHDLIFKNQERITSAEQARDIAIRVAPEIHAWAKSKILGQMVHEDGAPETPSQL